MVDLERIREILQILPKQLYRKREIDFELERAISVAEKITTTLTGMPSGSGGFHSKVEDGAIEISELREAYRETCDELEKLQNELIPFIESLSVPTEKAIMRLRYIRGYTDQEISMILFQDKKTIWRKRRTAENKILKIQ